MSVKMRQEVEAKIATALVKSAIAAGYAISIDTGDEATRLMRAAKPILSLMFKTDEEHLYLWKNGVQRGWVFLVYGNDGWDVISDYTVNLEPIMVEANKISDHYAD